MYTEDYKFSERLKTLRKSKKLTQVQISELIGVQQGTYSRWENGTLEPGLEFVVKLANIFGTTTDYLLGQKPYSIISSLPLEQLDLTNIANFSKDEFDILKHSIAVSVARNKIKATELKDRVIEKNQLSEKDAELLNKIFEEVKKVLKKSGFENQLPNGIVLAGAGSNLKGIDEYARKQLQLATRIGKNGVERTVSQEVNKPEFSAAVGLIIEARNVVLRREEYRDSFEPKSFGFFARFFKKKR